MGGFSFALSPWWILTLGIVYAIPEVDLRGTIGTYNYECSYNNNGLIMNSDYMCMSSSSPDLIEESSFIFPFDSSLATRTTLVVKSTKPEKLVNNDFLRSLFWPRLIQNHLAQEDDITLYNKIALSPVMPNETSAMDCLMDHFILLIEAQTNDLQFSGCSDATCKLLFNIHPEATVCFLPTTFNLLSKTFHGVNSQALSVTGIADSSSYHWSESLQFLIYTIKYLCGMDTQLSTVLLHARCSDSNLLFLLNYLSFFPGSTRVSLIDAASLFSLSPAISPRKKQFWREYLSDRGIKEALDVVHPLVFVKGTPHYLLPYFTLHLSPSASELEQTKTRESRTQLPKREAANASKAGRSYCVWQKHRTALTNFTSKDSRLMTKLSLFAPEKHKSRIHIDSNVFCSDVVRMKPPKLTLPPEFHTLQRMEEEASTQPSPTIKSNLFKKRDLLTKSPTLPDTRLANGSSFVLPSSVSIFQFPVLEYRLPNFKAIKGSSDNEIFTQFSEDYKSWRRDWRTSATDTCITGEKAKKLDFVLCYLRNFSVQPPRKLRERTRAKPLRFLLSSTNRQEANRFKPVSSRNYVSTVLDELTVSIYNSCSERKTQWLERIAKLSHSFFLYHHLRYRDTMATLITAREEINLKSGTINRTFIAYPTRVLSLFQHFSSAMLSFDLVYTRVTMELRLDGNQETIDEEQTQNKALYDYIMNMKEQLSNLESNVKKIYYGIKNAVNKVDNDLGFLFGRYTAMTERFRLTRYSSSKQFLLQLKKQELYRSACYEVIRPFMKLADDERVLELWQELIDKNYYQQIVKSTGFTYTQTHTYEHLKKALIETQLSHPFTKEYFPNQMITLIYILVKHSTYCDRYLHWTDKEAYPYRDPLYTAAIGASEDSILAKLVSLKQDLPHPMLEIQEFGYLGKIQLVELLDSLVGDDWSYEKLKKDIPHLCKIAEHQATKKSGFIVNHTVLKDMMYEHSVRSIHRNVVLYSYNILSTVIIWRQELYKALKDIGSSPSF